MLLIRLTLDLYGEKLNLSTIQKMIKEPFDIVDSNKALEYKYMSIEHPRKIGVEYDLQSYEKWYVNFIRNNYTTFKRYGVKEMNIFINVFYSGQCNFEIFDKKLLALLSQYKISLPISIYALSNKELKEILKEKGCSDKRISAIFQSEPDY